MTPFTDGIELLSSRAGFLIRRGANGTSQFGEDGLVAAALEKIGCENQWCFEVGAADGLFFSNTARLRDAGWNTVLIEGDESRFAALEKLASATVHVVREQVYHPSLDRILAECGAPADLDFGVIDIDGQDYWVWDGLKNFSPRLMLVEYEYGSNDKPDAVPELGASEGQATLKAIVRLGTEKGYEALALTHCNVLFCRSELLS